MERPIILIGLSFAIVFGLAGGFLPTGLPQNAAWYASSVGFVVASLVLASRTYREGFDLSAIGVLLVGLGELAIIAGGTAQDPGSVGAFALGAGLYAPGFLLIALNHRFPLWSRLSGLPAAVLFLGHTGLHLAGREEPSTALLPGLGYAFLAVAVAGWAWVTIRSGGPRASSRVRPSRSGVAARRPEG